MSQPTNFRVLDLCEKCGVSASESVTIKFDKGTSEPVLLAGGSDPVLAYIFLNQTPNTQIRDKVTLDCK
jgi:hypothetical protein